MEYKLLKEWAIVCRALGDGRQIFIARKGGIIEEEGEFVVQNREFFLFPTYLHQSRDQILPSYYRELDLVEAEEPKDGKIQINLWASVTDEIRVTYPDQLKGLQGEHLWNQKVLESRFEWGTEKSLMLLVLRVYQLPEPIRIPIKPKYGGCKSWVLPEEPVRLPRGIKAALSDTEFHQKRTALLKKITELGN